MRDAADFLLDRKPEPLSTCVKKKMDYREIIDFEALYESLYKCRRSVSWKPSVKSFTLDGVEKCLKMEKELQDGTWEHGKPKPITIRYPKLREGLSIPFRDRVYQRSLNDHALYPIMSKSFIIDNCACQKGKGTDFARARLKKHIWNHYSHYGTDGFVIQIDIKGYYQNMRHDVVDKRFKAKLPRDIHAASMSVLGYQYRGEVGFNPGSQMVQIAGVSTLDPVDHYAKEQLHLKHYMRYMDDLWALVGTMEEAEKAFEALKAQIETLGFNIHPDKSHIRPLSKGFYALGFDYRITKTGKIIMTVKSDTVRSERRKLRRMATKVARGEMTESKMRECYFDWKDFVNKGNSHKLLCRMDAYYKSLMEEIANGNIH